MQLIIVIHESKPQAIRSYREENKMSDISLKKLKELVDKEITKNRKELFVASNLNDFEKSKMLSDRNDGLRTAFNLAQEFSPDLVVHTFSSSG